MAKYQVFFALLAVSVAFVAAGLPSEDQKAADTAAVLYRAPYPYHYGGYSPAVGAPYAYAAAVPAVAPTVVAAPYAHALPAEPLVHPVYAPAVQVLPAPASYVYAPARYGYAHGHATPASYTYTHVSRGW